MLGRDCSEFSLYVVRLHRDGQKLSRPCDMCMQKIKAAGIKTVIYSTDNGYTTEKVA